MTPYGVMVSHKLKLMGIYMGLLIVGVNFVFIVPSYLPLLHTAMPTPAFWHTDLYIFFLSCFCVCLFVFWLLNYLLEDRQLHAAAANGDLR